ncbi:type II toxin-antitoxin system VapC family toxin [Acidithiobacillus thiooxidans]|uniref:type II toxin-antitoxin system VapC family toxin n=1 Tax=Acidithiobacillus thiooxidans TaxID=930 RepID=UPI0028583337|nr:type II toxin-antitoxin system VapC family toxin [Acidithiobacillus thiooxidans]MDR7927616.1 type II toxin-antitoxin system VapC family toxin [Acidithiobacillus thiooxidans]
MNAKHYEAEIYARHQHLYLSDEIATTISAKKFETCFEGDVVISAITLTELEYDITCSAENQLANQAALDDLLQDIPVATFDSRVARAYGQVRWATREHSRNALDKLITAHAIALNTTLITNNEADFRVFPGLTVENWVDN